MIRDIEQTVQELSAALFSQAQTESHWRGRLSSSALATATSIFTLHLADPEKYRNHIDKGLAWLACNLNSDCGWGDTVLSKSNPSTTLLSWVTLRATDLNLEYESITTRTEQWLKDKIGGLEGGQLAQAIYKIYQQDRTFSLPILTMCGLAELPGEEQAGLWPLIEPLPFELAVLPRPLYRWLSLSVVSYAMPALISIGLVNFRKNHIGNRIRRIIRGWSQPQAIRVLGRLQPGNGGFLEAPR